MHQDARAPGEKGGCGFRDEGPAWVIAAAVNSELDGLRRAVGVREHQKLAKGELWAGLLEGQPVWLVRTGIGPERVRQALSSVVVSRQCRGIISIGYAGGLREGYEVGDLVIPAEIRSLPPLPEGVYFPDRILLARACKAAGRQGRVFHTDRMLTSDRVIAESREKRELGRTHDAGSVEMESAVVAEIAAQGSIPFLVVRSISDTVASTLPDLRILQYARQRRRLEMLRYVVSKPRDTLRLLRLRNHGRIAAENLTAFVAGGFLDGLVRLSPC